MPLAVRLAHCRARVADSVENHCCCVSAVSIECGIPTRSPGICHPWSPADPLLAAREGCDTERPRWRAPGYVGYEESGQLTEAVRRRPYNVVLLDEVEKVHHEVFDVLLQVLDDGCLTDGQCCTVDFRNTILILTSNLGSNFPMGPLLKEEQKKEKVLQTIRSAFRPEFLYRLDDLVSFHPLGTD